MKNIKYLLFRLIKYQLKSLVVFIAIGIIYLFKRKKIIKMINKKYDVVHIICPGPTAEEFYKHKLKENEAVIFLNFAVLIARKVNSISDKYFFSADGSRTNEAIATCYNDFKSCTSILATTHLFHLNLKTLRNVNYILFPHVKVSKQFGLEGKMLEPQMFEKISPRFFAYGFGSLNNSLQLAVAFNPKKISIWGCDLGEKNGVRYFDPKVPVRPTEDFDIARSHFQTIKQKILSNNIEMERNGLKLNN